MQTRITNHTNTSKKNGALTYGIKTEMPGHEWRVVELGKVCQARKEIVQPLQEKKSKYVGLEHLDTGEEKLKRFALGSEVRSAKYRFQAGDILYGKLRPYLDKAVIADFGGICSTDMIVISVDTNRADRDYILYSLHLPSFVSYTTSTMTGVNHPRTSWKAISVFRIPLPPLLEQQGIAKVLGTVQRTIEQQDKIIEATKVLKKSLLQKLFREGIGHSEFRETEIGTIPADWDIIKLGDFAVFKNGINFNPKQRGKGTLTVDVLNMYGEPIYINLDKLYRVDISNAKNATDYLLRKGDVLFVRSSLKKEGVGWASLFNGSQEPVTFCGFIIRARVNNANISSEFLTYFLRSDFAREQLVAGSEQVAITNVNQGALRNLKIPFPSLPEQKEIAHCLSTVDRKIEAETKRKATLRKVFRTVRHILITGGIRLKNVEG